MKLLLQLVLALMLSACVQINVQRIPDMPVASARMQPVGTGVNVEGVVTVASGAIDEGFALQDASGGIYVTRSPGGARALGDKVRISGKITLPDNKQIAIDPVSINALGSAGVPAPALVKTGVVGSATEGQLITVQGRLVTEVEDDQPWGWKLYLDDGSGKLLVFVATATRIDVTPLRAGQSLRVTGFSGRYEQHTELLPRGASDIVQMTR